MLSVAKILFITSRLILHYVGVAKYFIKGLNAEELEFTTPHQQPGFCSAATLPPPDYCLQHHRNCNPPSGFSTVKR